MGIAITIIIAIAALAAGYFIALAMSRKNAGSQANLILDEARREADVIKEKSQLKAKEEEMRIVGEAERAASQRYSKIQSAEARLKQREIQLNQQQGDNARRKKELDTLKTNLDNREQLLENRHAEVESLQRQAQDELVRISGLSAEEAKEKLIESLKDEAKTAAAGYINDIMVDAKMTANK